MRCRATTALVIESPRESANISENPILQKKEVLTHRIPELQQFAVHQDQIGQRYGQETVSYHDLGALSIYHHLEHTSACQAEMFDCARHPIQALSLLDG